MRTDDLDFVLPPDLIAQAPLPDRAESRLLRYQRDSRTLAHHRFAELPALLREGDLLVFNDARVTPARFTLIKDTGGKVEGLFLAERSPGEWSVLLKNHGPINPQRTLRFIDAEEIGARVTAQGSEGEYRLIVNSSDPALVLLARIGRMPLPPYIKRHKEHDDRDAMDRQRYQTIFARSEGSVAAPTAGLHFTDALLANLTHRGIERAFVTLHVGLGTFKPVTSDTLESHHMHIERYTISEEAAQAINRAKRERRRIIPVGTTSARVLESQPEGDLGPTTGETGIFIYPPYRWKHSSALITNFHLPRSTLIALVGAMVGLDEQKRIYAEAIAQRYRFFSYGDAMFVD